SALVSTSPNVFSNRSIAWLMLRLRQELLSLDSAAPVVIEGLMLQLIAEVSRKRVTSGADTPHWLQQTIELLRDRFAEPLTLSTIARSAGVHPVYLASAFRHRYHCSVGEYLRRVRIEYASDKIANTNTPLVEVAFLAGFSNQSHFTRIFKRCTGMTPAQ